MRCRCGVDVVSIDTRVSTVSMCVDRVESVLEGGLTREMIMVCQPVSECQVSECVERVERVERETPDTTDTSRHLDAHTLK